ncbi:HAMP domain-containing histidine kinase [Streptomyces sp. Je 1-79]|uniref:sensor histidine kinase n=1 Tax=Streptomyces sp. Je 1-79 TaxID=2943847 RepID=UPI0021A3AE81|nr:HAMP domain-containing sensor histidine kinase [Streptomyces sp. Je 1-79]MCT4352204.1 HAMP domain-containing histidine kinase [Streptomyces sp. Je 1-79]
MRRRSRAPRPARGGARSRLPLRKSLLGRFLGVFALVAACSVAATAWIASQATSGALKQEQGQSLADDARIYDALLGYAATHPRWDGVDGTVQELASRFGRRIAVTTQNRGPLADSAGGSGPQLPTRASAVVDPLSVDSALAGALSARDDSKAPWEPGSGAAGRIDARAVGPFRLPPAERRELREKADRVAACLQRQGERNVEVTDGPSGRPRISQGSAPTGRVESYTCSSIGFDTPTKTEAEALEALTRLANACLSRQDRPAVTLNPDLTWPGSERAGPVATPVPGYPGEPSERPAAVADASATPVPAPTELDRSADEAIGSCVNTARREQLSSYVAQPALLFIGDPDRGSVPGFDLSAANTARIAGAAALVLALTIGVSVLTGRRLVRPLRALTGAAQRMKDGAEATPVPVPADDEIGQLAAAFMELTEHRARLEAQRKAMVSDVAHELRTPLSNIRGWLEAAQDGVADTDPALIASLLEEAVQLQHIIDDLQDLAEADAGALRLHPEPVDVADLLGHVAAAHQAEAERAGVTLRVEVPEPAPALTADPVRLRQVVGNLVSNAVRHTPRGGRVDLRAYGAGVDGACDGPVSEVVVEVADTGSGIAAADLPHVFERFWRAERSRSRRTGGSGLGLAIVRKLAEAHGGSATAASAEGLGSTFTLRLPPGTREAADRHAKV